MRKKTAKKLFKCVDDILSSMEMLTKFKGNSYMVSKVKKVCSDNTAVLENEKDAGQRYSELLNEFKKKIESSDIEGAKKALQDSLSSNDTELIKSNTEALQKCLYDMTEKMYNSVNGDNASYEDNHTESKSEPGVYDADFREV